ncbi:ABC transporter substrate-binding protein [Streptomyces paludis]|uniref:ABC transporter substrate-binding protein n=1 Tax=Streptomyces paludis TaxID=2282738 RepID=UPI0013B4515E|nr:ABC transporter substrate-binding protein [Streptomyces paludis]
MAALAGTLLLATLTACGGSSDKDSGSGGSDVPFSTISAGELTVGVPTFPPFSSLENGRIVGPDGDVVYKIAEKYGLKVVAKPYEFSALIPAVRQKRIDIAIGSIFRTKERAKVIDFTDPIYIEPGSIISKSGISTVDELKGKKVGTVQGYNWVEDIDKVLNGKLKQYPSSVELKQDLEAGRIEAGLDSYGTSLHLYKGTGFTVKTLEPDPQVAAATTPGQVAFVLPKNDKDLKDGLDAVIATLHEDGGIAAALKKAGLDPDKAETGKPSYL